MLIVIACGEVSQLDGGMGGGGMGNKSSGANTFPINIMIISSLDFLIFLVETV